MKYLVQYGPYDTAKIVEATSDHNAIREVFNGLVWGEDYDWDVYVIELPKGKLFGVSRDLIVTAK